LSPVKRLLAYVNTTEYRLRTDSFTKNSNPNPVKRKKNLFLKYFPGAKFRQKSLLRGLKIAYFFEKKKCLLKTDEFDRFF